MGTLVNPGNEGFISALRSEIYVDKTGLIDFTNRMMGTRQRFICVSRPRRFGKSMAAEMLMAYYSRGCDSGKLFAPYKVAKTKCYQEQLNRSNVICMDIQWFRSIAISKGIPGETLSYMQRMIIKELQDIYPEIISDCDVSLPETLYKVNEATGEQFIIIIDEWDCLFREEQNNKSVQEDYLNFLRGMFKGFMAEKTVKLAYMTGILPIKKYGTQSALNNFSEYSMVNPYPLEEYIGFTDAEVRGLCEEYHMDFEEMQRWYDGYTFADGLHIYNPKSVVESIWRKWFGNYWSRTETFESLRKYIDMDEDGLRESIISMLGNLTCHVDTNSFQNDMTSIKKKDDVLTLLVHLGYLSYDSEKQEVRIPNREVADEFRTAVESSGWQGVSDALRESEALLEATIQGDEAAVARGLDKVHEANTSVFSYNNELSLSCVMTIAYYAAKRDYAIFRELPTGKGFADLVFLPGRKTEKPAMVIELKWDKSALGAISQIKERNYTGALTQYKGNLLLVGINYDRASKKHECVIERYQVD